MNRTKFFTVFSLVVIAAMVLSACGGSATTPAPTSAPDQPTATTAAQPTAEPTSEPQATGAAASPIVLPAEIDPSAVEGDIITAGSSTVFPLTERMAELFQDEGYTGNITIDSIGTGAGFERFCKTGETDISNASRPIKQEEIDNCKAIGRDPIELRVGTDALAVAVSEQNTFVDNLSLADLKKVFSGEAKLWSDVNPAWPAEKIQFYSPGTDSGTFDYFVEKVLEKKKELLLGVEGAQFSEDDNVLVQGVEGSPYAIGYFGYAYYAEAGGKLKALSIEGVAPDKENVDNGTYPLARPLFIYSDAKIMAEKPQVAAFIGFYLQHVNDAIGDVGYFPAPAAELDVAIAVWRDVMESAK